MSTALAENRAQRSERQQQREVNILAAAREALTEKGYDGVTMNALAEKAGVVKKTLYNLYGSKDDLLLAAISEVIDSYRDQGSGADRGIPAIIASRAAATRQIVATPEYAEAMTRALVQAEAGHALVRVLLKDAVANNLSNLQAAAANGEMEPHVDIAELAEQLVSQGWGLILLWMKGLVPLDQVEARSLRGLVTLLLAVTRGPRRRALTELLTHTMTLQRVGKSP